MQLGATVQGGRLRRAGLGSCLAVLALGLCWAFPVHADRAQARVLYEQGARAERNGDTDKALTLYQQAIAEDMDFVRAYERVIPLWMQRGLFRTVITELERFTLRHPKRAFAWYALAYAYRRSGQPEFAAMSYESYIALRPRDATPYFGLGMVRLDLGDQTGARAAFATYVRMEQNPARVAFVERARRELALLGGVMPTQTTGADGGGAVGTSTPGAGGATTETHGEAQSSKAQGVESSLREIALLTAEGRHEEALALARGARAREPQEQLRLAMWRAHLLSALGRTEAARTVLWAVLAAAPTHVAAFRMLAELRRADGVQ